MESGYCERGHRVYWAELDGRRIPVVRVARMLTASAAPAGSTSGVELAPLYHCYRRHDDICPSETFTPNRVAGTRSRRTRSNKSARKRRSWKH